MSRCREAGAALRADLVDLIHALKGKPETGKLPAAFGRDDRPGHPWRAGRTPLPSIPPPIIRSPYAAPFEPCLFPLPTCPLASMSPRASACPLLALCAKLPPRGPMARAQYFRQISPTNSISTMPPTRQKPPHWRFTTALAKSVNSEVRTSVMRLRTSLTTGM